MIESALVLIHASADGNDHIGCGALIEGGYIVTCRHVWEEATALAAVPVAVFLHCRDESGAPLRHDLTLVSDCRLGPPPHPDIVLLKPLLCPANAFRLQPATSDGYQTGEAEAQAMVHRPKDDGSDPWEEVTVEGTLRDRPRSDGRRQFSGKRDQGYWFVRGSSGSPLFKPGAHQLAGILSLAELGANDRKSTLHEAFVVPGTVVRQHLKQLVDAVDAEEHEHLLLWFSHSKGVDPEKLRPIFDRLANQGLKPAKIIAEAEKSVAKMLDLARAKPPPTNDGTDIDAALSAAREKLGRLDSAGALAGLAAKLAEEEEARRQRLLPLLRETAAIQRATYDHGSAKATLDQIFDLDPDSIWDRIALGDLHRDTGSLGKAREAFDEALATARRQDPEGRDVAAAQDRRGDVLVAQGEGAAALAAYRAGMAIRERLAAADPANAEWQRDLSISRNKIGDVLVAQGEGAAALAAYRAGMAIAERLAAADPANAEWQRDLSISRNKIGDVLVAQGEGAAALAAYRAGMAIRERLAAADPANAQWQRDLIVSGFRLAETDPPAAVLHLSRALAVARSLAASGRLTPVDAWMVAALERRLSDLGGPSA
jgi:predicted negative regulator of RcsB-dependent stress response